jgi:CubicO group peptidase (beta-lactamase class C family)
MEFGAMDMAPFSPAGLAKIPYLLKTAIDAGDVPGIVTFVWHKGAIAQANAVGLRDIERHEAMHRESIFAIASMSKPLTIVAALKLVEQGRMKLDDPITKWAPEFSDMRVLVRPNASLDDSYPSPRVITIDDLMTHRSGLSYSFLSSGPLAVALMKEFGFGIESNLTPDKWMKAMASLPLAYAPGERFNYGHSTDVLGVIVGRASNSTLPEALQREVCEPLGMHDTDFWIPPSKRDRAVTFYNASPQLKAFAPFQLSAFTGVGRQDFASGGQGLVSTADDYLAFARMLIRGGQVEGRQYLKAELVRLMTTDRLTAAQRLISSFVTPPWSVAGFGLGVSVITDAQGYAASGWGVGSKGSFGWPGLFGGWWQADPIQDMILIWLVQVTPPPPSAGVTPRFPGVTANRQFQQLAYSALSS